MDLSSARGPELESRAGHIARTAYPGPQPGVRTLIRELVRNLMH